MFNVKSRGEMIQDMIIGDYVLKIDIVEKEKMEIAWKSMGEVEFERFSGCKFC